MGDLRRRPIRRTKASKAVSEMQRRSIEQGTDAMTPLEIEAEIAAVRDALLDRITLNPDQCGGRPCVRGMRIRVSDVLELLAEGQSHEEILEAYPYLELDDIAACLRYAAR